MKPQSIPRFPGSALSALSTDPHWGSQVAVWFQWSRRPGFWALASTISGSELAIFAVKIGGKSVEIWQLNSDEANWTKKKIDESGWNFGLIWSKHGEWEWPLVIPGWLERPPLSLIFRFKAPMKTWYLLWVGGAKKIQEACLVHFYFLHLFASWQHNYVLMRVSANWIPTQDIIQSAPDVFAQCVIMII